MIFRVKLNTFSDNFTKWSNTKVVGSRVGGQRLERWRGMALLFSSRFKLFLKNFRKTFSISHYSHACHYGNESAKFYTETFTFCWMKACKRCAKNTRSMWIFTRIINKNVRKWHHSIFFIANFEQSLLMELTGQKVFW